MAQRLVRILCAKCAVEVEPPGDQLDAAAAIARAGGLDWAALPRRFRRAVGCAACTQTGFRGRRVISEVLEVSPDIGAALRRGEQAEAIRAIAVREGMTTMAADGIRRAAEGQTTIEEVLRTAPRQR